MEKKEVKWGKWFALGLGGLIGLSHIGMIGSLSNRQSKLPTINLPVGPYTHTKQMLVIMDITLNIKQTIQK